jgi:hypothetical protein
MKRCVLAACVAFQCLQVSAQSPEPHDGVPEVIAAQRSALTARRSEITVTYDTQARDCWQKFAVNACLSDARRARRAAIEPIQQEELRLNAQERAWRTEQRILRLEGKQATGAATP